MVTSARFPALTSCLLACLIALSTGVHAQDGRPLSELRSITLDASVPMAERVEAYLELAPELTDKQERIELADVLLDAGLVSRAKVDVTIAKARATAV